MDHRVYAYPAGRSAVALLFLRVSLLASFASLVPLSAPESVLLASLVVLLLLGAATRVAALASAAALLWSAKESGGALLGLLAPIFTAAALALIGPGAFSIDAIRFGRRTIRLSDPSGRPR